MKKHTETYKQVRQEYRQKNTELMLDRLKDIAWGLVAGALFMIACGSLYYVTVMAR